MAKEGSTVSGLMDSLATMTSHLAAVRRAAARPGQQVRPHALRARPASPATPRSRSPSRSWTTSSAGWARASCRRTIATRSGSSPASATSRRRRRSAGPFGAGAASLGPAPALEPLRRNFAESDLTTDLVGEAGRAQSVSERAAQPPRARRRAAPTSPSHSTATRTATPMATPTAATTQPIKPLDLGGGTKVAFSVSADSPSCSDCGSIMVRNGSCYKCLNCGSTSGCS